MTKRAIVTWSTIFTIAFVMVVAVAQDAEAIPAFTRKYKTSCVTCHEAFPRLNAVGEAFRLNGFKFIDDDLYTKEEPVELGDEAYKKVWPKSLWPSDIPGLPPISIRVLFDTIVDTGGEQSSSTTFDFPHEVELVAAGALGDSMSFMLEIEVEGDEVSAGGWLQFEDLFGVENAFNIKLGGIGEHSFGPYTARDYYRFTKNHYLYANWRLPYPGGFATKNRYRLRSGQPGIEVNGFGARWVYAAGLVEGAGDISDKDYYFTFAYKMGGATVDGSDAEGGTLGSSDFWRDDSVTLSFFAYRGTGLVEYGGEESKDGFWRIGPGVSFKNRDFRIGLGYVTGEHDNPYGALTDASAETNAWFVELEYWAYPWLIPNVRYEELSFDLPNVSGFQSDRDIAQFVAAVKILIRANVTASIEARFATKDEQYTMADLSKDIGNRMYVRIDFAF